MTHALTMLVTALLAWKFAGVPERLTASLIVSAAGSRLIVQGAGAPPAINDDLSVWVAVSLCVGTFAIALRANRSWPLWVAALQLVALGIAVLEQQYPQHVLQGHTTPATVIPYLVQGALIFGIWQFQRCVRVHGYRPADWSPWRL